MDLVVNRAVEGKNEFLLMVAPINSIRTNYIKARIFNALQK